MYGVSGELKVCDVHTGRELFSRTNNSTAVTAVAFRPDGAWLAYADGTTVKVLETATGQEQFSLRGHTDAVKGLAFSPDGLRLASSSIGRLVKVWDLRTGTEVLDLKGHTGWVYAVAFSPDGRRLASAGDGWVIKLWEATLPVALTEQLTALRRDLAGVERRLTDFGPAAMRAAASSRAREGFLGGWRVEGRELVQGSRMGGPGTHLVFGDPQWTDLDFELEGLRGDGTEGFAVACRTPDPENGFFFQVGGWGNQFHGAICYSNGKAVLAAAKQPGAIQQGRWYKVRVEARGRRLRCLLDGQVLFDIQDERHPRGGVGLRCFDSVTRFRNLKVTAPDGTVLFEGLPRLAADEIDLLVDRAAWLRGRIADLEGRLGLGPTAR
jgi:hypothetical protein